MFTHVLTKPLALALTGTSLLAPALAHADEAHTFVRDGISYEYKAHDYGTATVLTGTADAKEFRLVVKNGLVHGEFNGHAVQFKVADAAADKALAVK